MWENNIFVVKFCDWRASSPFVDLNIIQLESVIYLSCSYLELLLAGPCKGKIDVAADIVYTKPGTRNFRVYNTYFFRTDHFWLYQNGNHRPRFGDPLKIVQRLGEWSGLPEYLDAFLHYHEYSDVTETYTDEYLFFKGATTLVNLQVDVSIPCALYLVLG